MEEKKFTKEEVITSLEICIYGGLGFLTKEELDSKLESLPKELKEEIVRVMISATLMKTISEF